jgi:hypothetical protein
MYHTLDDLLKDISQHIHRVLMDDHAESLMPMYHIVGDENLVIGCPWRNEEEKLLVLRAIKQTARQNNATMIGFVCEMWMTKHKTQDLINYVPPSQSPDRIEGVMAMVTDGAETKVNFWQIIRNRPGGTIISLIPEATEAGMFSGRMIDDLLPHKTTRH